ncbi:MAG: hypothetical protein P1V36_01940 [Planctomycetota bacterium]|nr:hypothetical protein [Planctomycetota bacterium]
MRTALALALMTSLACAVGCNSSNARARTAAAPASTSITSAPRAQGTGWTTPQGATTYSGSPQVPAYRSAPQAVTVTPRTPAQTPGFAQQPPIMDDLPQPPPVNLPAEATWTPPPVAGEAGTGAGAGCGGGKG